MADTDCDDDVQRNNGDDINELVQNDNVDPITPQNDDVQGIDTDDETQNPGNEDIDTGRVSRIGRAVKKPSYLSDYVTDLDDSEDLHDILIVSLNVDDLLFTSSSEALITIFKDSMKDNFDMSDLGRMKHFLGVEVTQGKQGIFITQQRYIAEILSRFGMEDSKPVNNPVIAGNKHRTEIEEKGVDPTGFKQIIGSLMYLNATRPDIMYAVSIISRAMDRPTERHLVAAKRILRYLRGTADLGIMYKVGEKQDLVAFCDSDFAGDVEDRKSTTGFVFLMSSGAVSWSSKKQPIVTLSTTEAEYVAAAYCVCQGVWLKRIVKELGLKIGKCLTVFCDNSSTIKLSKNHVMHGRSKHIDIRYHFLRNMCKEGTIELKFINSENQLADLLKKPLKNDSFIQL